MKNLKIFIAFIVTWFVCAELQRRAYAHIPSVIIDTMFDVAALGIIYYIFAFPFIWLYKRYASKRKSEATVSNPTPASKDVGASVEQFQNSHALSATGGTSEDKKDLQKDSAIQPKETEYPAVTLPLKGAGITSARIPRGTELSYTGRSYTQVHFLCFGKWDGGIKEGEEDFDYIDRIDFKYNITMLKNTDTGECVAYWNLTETMYDGESFNEAINACFENAEPAIKSLYAGLAISAKDEDEDGIYEHLAKHGGKLDFAMPTDPPTDLNDSGTFCIYRLGEFDNIVICSTGKDPQLQINGTDVASFSECYEDTDYLEERVAVYISG